MLALGLLLAGCAASVGRVLPENVRRIAVSPVRNATDQELLPALMDEELRRAFRLDGRLVVVEDPAEADAVLEGTLASYTRQPSRFASNNIVQEYLCRTGVDLVLSSRPGSESLWVDRGKAGGPPGPSVRRVESETHYTVIPASGLPVETEEDAQRRIVRDLADAAVRRVLEGW